LDRIKAGMLQGNKESVLARRYASFEGMTASRNWVTRLLLYT